MTNMKTKTIIFDFGSDYFTIYADGRLLLRKPCAVIIKRTLQPTVVAYGEDAVARMNDVTNEEMFWRPVKKGAVAHREGCILMVRTCIAEAIGKLARPTVCVLVGCGLSPEQRLEIQRIFVDAGYTDVFLMENLMGIMPYAATLGIKAGIIIGGETTDIGIFDGNNLISGYTIDIGADTVDEKIKAYISDNYKLVISDAGAAELKSLVASLYRNDYSRYSVTGLDAITGRAKKLTVNGKELYRSTSFVYARILKVLDAALTAAPIDIIREVERTGILIAGIGSRQVGLSDYVTDTLKVPCHIVDEKRNLPLAGAAELCADKNFVDEYLGITQPKTYSFRKK